MTRCLSAVAELLVWFLNSYMPISVMVLCAYVCSHIHTRCDDLKLTEIRVIICDGKLNDDISEGW